MTSYRVEENGDGTFDVTKDGRAVLYSADADEVRDVVGERSVRYVEKDGYESEWFSWEIE